MRPKTRPAPEPADNPRTSKPAGRARPPKPVPTPLPAADGAASEAAKGAAGGPSRPAPGAAPAGGSGAPAGGWPPFGQSWASPLETLRGRRILLTVTGGVAAYKAAELARLFTRSGAVVRVAMTESAKRFVTPLTFSSLTGQPVAGDLWEGPKTMDHVAHVAWARWAEAMVVAPATANFLAKMAHGLADDFPSTAALAFGGPKLAAPAMNSGMLANPATADNLSLLVRRGVRVLGSPEGELACGSVGAGRLAEVEAIALETARLLARGPLDGRRVVVTGGATREPWDDIRFISNRSSGRMGLALAMAAWLMGAETVLIAGRSAAVPPVDLGGLSVVLVDTAEDMLGRVAEALPGAWALAMNAAPADFQPARRVPGKIAKSGSAPTSLPLERTTDILKAVGARKGSAILVGFAAESGDLEARAEGKLRDKGLDFIAANQAGGLSDAFESPEVALTLISASGGRMAIGPGPKFQAAWTLWEAVSSGGF